MGHLLPHTVEQATKIILQYTYRDKSLSPSPITHQIPPNTIRNQLVRELYQSGVSVPTLAIQFGISKARVYQILKGKRS
jgi:DNA invertase Pin-like site-specific DNA recombinase